MMHYWPTHDPLLISVCHCEQYKYWSTKSQGSWHHSLICEGLSIDTQEMFVKITQGPGQASHQEEHLCQNVSVLELDDDVICTYRRH